MRLGVVDDDGSVTRSSDASWLVDRPMGASSSCEYTSELYRYTIAEARLGP